MKVTDSPATSADFGVEPAIARLVRGATALPRWGLQQRIELLDRLRRDTLAVAPEWVRAACIAKKLDPGGPLAAEEWLSGPVTVLRNLRCLTQTLSFLQRTGHPRLSPSSIFSRGNRLAISVFPDSLDDRIVLGGFRAELRMQQGMIAEEIQDRMAPAYFGPESGKGGVCAVLGAGNVSSIGLLDVLHKIFSENRVCVLKMNPVNAYLAPFYQRAFAAAEEANFLQILSGDGQVGAELIHHSQVDEVHMTGSTVVHDTIVWGSPEVREANRLANTPVLKKPITSELGCVTPVVLVPGKWSPRQLRHQAWNVASMVVNNASFNCNSAKVLITSEAWQQREEFLSLLAETLAQIPSRHAYYPGSKVRHQAFCEAHPQVQLCGTGNGDFLPWALATGLNAEAEDPTAFANEAWCGVLAETSLAEADPSRFLVAATEFCNERLFGTLSCCVILHPQEFRRHRKGYEQALADLRYGSVAVNHWPAISYGLGVTPWGAHPGHTLQEIGSGLGFVHNTRMFCGIEKCIVEGSFLGPFRPPWFANHRLPRKLAVALARYEAVPGIGRFLPLLLHGIRG